MRISDWSSDVCSSDLEAREVAEKFEAFFLSQVVEHMFTGLEPDALFGGGQAEGVYRSMLFREYGAAVARSGGLANRDMVQQEILRVQVEPKQLLQLPLGSTPVSDNLCHSPVGETTQWR